MHLVESINLGHAKGEMATLLLTLLFLYYCSYANFTSTYAILIFFRQGSRISIIDDIFINDLLLMSLVRLKKTQKKDNNKGIHF